MLKHKTIHHKIEIQPKQHNTIQNTKAEKIVCILIQPYITWVNQFCYFPTLAVKSNQADPGVWPLILPCCALINSRGEILCSDAFTLHLWTPQPLSSQPSFYHQTKHLMRLSRVRGQLLNASVRACGWASVPHVLQLGLCCWIYRGQPGNFQQSMITSWVPRHLTRGLSVAAVVRLH